jgi:hypothetical protein
MSTISITELYDFLCAKFDKETAKNFVNFIEAKMNTDLENKIQHLATKEDLANVKVDLIKWIFAFWITIVLMLVGLYLKN